MNYYKTRVLAINEIDSLLAASTPVDVIIYKISMKYGFNKKIVEERIQQLENIQDAFRKDKLQHKQK